VLLHTTRSTKTPTRTTTTHVLCQPIQQHMISFTTTAARESFLQPMSKTHKPMRYSSLVSALLYPSSPIPKECAHGTFISNVNYLRKKFETTTSMTIHATGRGNLYDHGDTEQQDSVFHQCKPCEHMETLYNKIVLSANASHSKVIAQRSDEPRKEDTEEQDGVSVLTCYKSNNNG